MKDLKDIKVGETVYVNSAGLRTDNTKDIKVVIERIQKSEHTRFISGKSSFCLIGKTKNGKEWFSKYFIKD